MVVGGKPYRDVIVGVYATKIRASIRITNSMVLTSCKTLRTYYQRDKQQRPLFCLFVL